MANEASYSPNRLLVREHLANRKSKWYSSDSPENYRDNYHELSDYFKNCKITYTWNSDGYRTKYEFDELVPEQFVLCFGCSYTEGVGVDDNDTWSSCLEKLIKKPCINMGMAGGSTDAIVANSNLWMNNRYPKPHFVMIQIPETSREPKVFIDNDRGTNEFVNKYISNYVVFPSYDLDSHHWNREKVDQMARDRNIISRHFVTSNNLAAISLAWRNWGVPVLFWTYDADGDIIMHPEDVMRISGELCTLANGDVDFARDMAHNGKQSSENIARMLEYRYHVVQEWRNSDSLEPQPYTKNKNIPNDDYPASWNSINAGIDYNEIKGRRPFIYE